MKLFLDDIRNPPNDEYIIVRSTNEAIEHIKKHGMPDFISFDHDLGENDTTMMFLHKLYNEIWTINDPIPGYTVHSANPIGKLNIISFMESWKKSTEIKSEN